MNEDESSFIINGGMASIIFREKDDPYVEVMSSKTSFCVLANDIFKYDEMINNSNLT